MMQGITNNPYVDGYVVMKPMAAVPSEWTDYCCEHRFPGAFILPLNGTTRLSISLAGLVLMPHEQHSAAEVRTKCRRLVTQVLDRHRKARCVWKDTHFTIDGLPMAAARALCHEAARLTGFVFEGDTPNLSEFDGQAAA